MIAELVPRIRPACVEAREAYPNNAAPPQLEITMAQVAVNKFKKCGRSQEAVPMTRGAPFRKRRPSVRCCARSRFPPKTSLGNFNGTRSAARASPREDLMVAPEGKM